MRLEAMLVREFVTPEPESSLKKAINLLRHR